MKLTEAIARQEGFYAKGSRPARNNNPGDIEFGSLAIRHGATGGDPRFAVFPSIEDGFAAMEDLLAKRYVGLTVEAALAKWAPPNENDVSAYLKNVCEWTGLAPDHVLRTEDI